MEKRFNVYFIEDGMQKRNSNLSVPQVGYLVNIILVGGGEITGIIDSEKD